MKLNLGCGYNKMEGYVNVDKDANCNPDIVTDLEKKLPFEDNSADEIVLNHVLEHLGKDVETYFSLWKEFYRVLKDQGVIKIVVPHWNHENFHHDPTHVRKVTPTGVNMFNQERNMQVIRDGGQETTLGLQLGIDVSVEEYGYDLVPDFQKEMEGKPFWFVEQQISQFNNLCYQVKIKAITHKPERAKK